MLARTATSVVIALNQQISSGTRKGDGGKRDLKGPSTPKVPQRRATQNMRG